MVKDMMKQNYGRPFFVCSKDANRCQYFEWADEIILPKPYCFHNETCKSWTVKKGPNIGKKFFDERCNFFQWAIIEEEEGGKDKENTPSTQKETEKRESDEKKQEKTTQAKKRQPLLFYTRQTQAR